VPLVLRIHEGLVWSNCDKRTPLYKMLGLIETLTITDPFYFVADAYCAAGRLSAQIGQSAGDPRQIQCDCVSSRRAEESAQEEGQTEAQWQEDPGRSQVEEEACAT
jgi:hypothetical protein